MDFNVYYFIGCIVWCGVLGFALYRYGYKRGYNNGHIDGYNKGDYEGTRNTNILWVDSIKRELSDVTEDQEIAIKLAKSELKQTEEDE